MYDIIIKNGRVVDGTGNPWFKADIAIKDGKIVSVRRGVEGDAQRVIDAEGMAVSPGFIDVHTHSDYSIISHKYADSSVHQGVTTEAVGQCGGTVFPLNETTRKAMQLTIAAFAQKSPEEIGEVKWSTLGEWQKEVEAVGISINIAPYLGHGTIRTHVMGPEGKGGERVFPTEEEMAKMKAEVAKAMEEGAFGMSTGLRYVPGRNATTREVIELAKVVAKYGGVYISHMRSEEEALISAVKELIQISEKAGLPASATHHKAMFPENWGKVHETLRLIDEARERGVEVICDFYPWTYARQVNLGSHFVPGLPPHEGVTDIPYVLRQLKDDATWEKIKATITKNYADEVARNEERKAALRSCGVTVADIWNPETFDYVVFSRTHPEFTHMNFRQIADQKGVADFWDVMRQIYLDDEGATYLAAGGMSEADIITILKHPASAVSTDSWVLNDFPTVMHLGTVAPHPRNYGTYPLVLERYVRELKVLRLEEAVRKMTSLPAEFLGLRDRGIIREGACADIVVFSPEKVRNNATWAEPCKHPDGIPYVLVNGVVTIDGGKHTRALSGQVLRNQQRR